MELFGYVKANTLTEEYILRQDMEQKENATIISRNNYNNKKFEIFSENKKVNIKIVISLNTNNIGINKNTQNVGKEYKNWAMISSNFSKSKINNTLKDYKERTNLINKIIEQVIQNNINGIIIDFTGIEENESMLRFVIEIAPRLREFGITTGIVLNNNMEKSDYISIVDYIIE